MLDKKYLKKINYLFSCLSIILILLASFAVQFDGFNISTIPSFSISLLAPVNNIIIDFCGASLGNVIISILSLNICYYVFIVLPFGLFNWVRGFMEWKH